MLTCGTAAGAVLHPNKRLSAVHLSPRVPDHERRQGRALPMPQVMATTSSATPGSAWPRDVDLTAARVVARPTDEGRRWRRTVRSRGLQAEMGSSPAYRAATDYLYCRGRAPRPSRRESGHALSASWRPYGELRRAEARSGRAESGRAAAIMEHVGRRKASLLPSAPRPARSLFLCSTSAASVGCPQTRRRAVRPRPASPSSGAASEVSCSVKLPRGP